LFALVLVFTLGLVTAVPAAAATINVPGDYATIQEAINAASANDTIMVAAGNYTEDLTIDVSVTLQGESSDNTTIKGVATEPDASFPLAVPNIDILSSGVSIHGFTIEGPDAVADEYASGMLIGASNVEIYGNDFKVTAGRDTWAGPVSTGIVTYRKVATGMETVDISGLNIHDNTFTNHGTGAAGFDAIFVNLDTGTGTATIADNDFTGNVARAISAERSNMVISGNNIITDLAIYSANVGGYQGMFIGCFPVGADPGPVQTDISITGNTVKGATASDGFAQGIRVGHTTQAGLEDITVSQNTVQYNNEGITVRADASGVTVSYNDIIDNDVGVQNDDTGVELDAEDNWWGTVNGPAHAGNTFNVGSQGDASSDNVDYVPWYDTDMTGDSFAPVTVGTGTTYHSSIQAGIDAASANDTISVTDGTYTENLVIPTENITVQAASSPVIDGGGMLGPGVHITAADVTFQGFTITNFTCTPDSGIGAMLVEGDGAVIDDNTIYDILPQGDPIDFPAGIGIDVHASNVEVTNNIVHDVGSIGIRVRHDWDTAPTVSNNVLLENNEVYRTANSGVLVTGYAKGVTIRENEIYESLEPTPYNLFVHWDARDVLIENNIIRDPYNVAYGHNVVLAGCDNVTISGNTITGATSGKNIYPSEDYLPWVSPDLLSTNVNITNNDIQDGAWGIKIGYDGTGDPSLMAATTTINFNNISGNTLYGVENTIATDVDATCNWWGDVAGPDHWTNPYSGWTDGDEATSDVDYIPWLIQSELAEDWNIWSVPIAPDEDSWVQMQADLVEAGVVSIYYFDSATQFWGADPDDAGPLDAFYIKMPDDARVRYCISSDATFPGQKAMKVGWNLVGLAELHDMHVDEAVLDAYWGTGVAGDLTGYSKVISPSLNGDYWIWQRDGGETPDMYPTRGYWVFMVNDGTLGGFTLTPIVEVENGP